MQTWPTLYTVLGLLAFPAGVCPLAGSRGAAEMVRDQDAAPPPSFLQRVGSRQEPFMVEFRILLKGGEDMNAIARKFSKEINTPHSDAASLIKMSMARVDGMSFPAVEMPKQPDPNPPNVAFHFWRPGSPPGPAPAAAPAPGPAPGPGEKPIFMGPHKVPPLQLPVPPAVLRGNTERDEVVAAGELAQQLAQQSKEIAQSNVAALKRLRQRTVAAALARRAALESVKKAGGTPPLWAPTSTTTTTTTPPPPPSMGRIVYDALVNAGMPPLKTTAAPPLVR